ncbi:MAG: insulinase family protein [Bryobacterales bacterium]|nr:insulinase family protein [Bryobacterales bacterium]
MRLALLLFLAAGLSAQERVVTLPGRSPLVTFRIVFQAGSAADPAGQAGLAHLTAAMLSEGGTRDLTYKQILETLYPMAVSVSSQVDKEMTTFSAETHVDNLEAFYKLFRSMLLDPGWREDDFKRVRDDTVNFLRVSLRGNNDEELGKEVLYNVLYAGHPYGRHNAGEVSALERITLEDVRRFYREHYCRANLILGLAGGYSPAFLEKVKSDFQKLPAGRRTQVRLPSPPGFKGLRMTVVEKDTRSVAYSMGFPIEVTRGHPDYPALLLAMSYFGQHRSSGGLLYNSIREARGLNYGDYSYIEYFPRGMFQFEPDPNLARSRQIFQIWIRPVEPATAHFTLRLALYELDRLVREGIPEDAFERTRSFVSKHVNLLTRTKRAELGYAIDSLFYGIPDYNSYVKKAVAGLTREEVNRAIRRHLNPGRLQIVAVAKDAEGLKRTIVSNAPSPMTYNSPKPKEILEEDKRVEKFPIPLSAADVTIVPVDRVFE